MLLPVHRAVGDLAMQAVPDTVQIETVDPLELDYQSLPW